MIEYLEVVGNVINLTVESKPEKTKNSSMKSKTHTLFAMTVQKEDTQVQTLYQSPYLRAILADKRITDTTKMISVANSSMAAALRYISNSK
jgi:hypothetical protein